jgi:hypothetical protein
MEEPAQGDDGAVKAVQHELGVTLAQVGRHSGYEADQGGHVVRGGALPTARVAVDLRSVLEPRLQRLHRDEAPDMTRWI